MAYFTINLLVTLILIISVSSIAVPKIDSYAVGDIETNLDALAEKTINHDEQNKVEIKETQIVKDINTLNKTSRNNETRKSNVDMNFIKVFIHFVIDTPFVVHTLFFDNNAHNL